MSAGSATISTRRATSSPRKPFVNPTPREHKDVCSSDDSGIVSAVARQTVTRLLGFDRPLLRHSRKQFVNWVARHIVDSSRVKNGNRRREIALRVVNSLTSGPATARKIRLATCNGGVLVQVTELGRLYATDPEAYSKMMHPSTAAFRTVQESEVGA